MSRKLSRDLSELKSDLIRKLKRDASRDKITISDCKKDNNMENDGGTRRISDSEIQVLTSMAANLGLDPNTKLKEDKEAHKKGKTQKRGDLKNGETTKSSKVKEDFLPAFFDGLTPQMKEKARVELGETEEKIRKGLAKLKASVEDGMPMLEDDILIAFLRVAKYDLKKAEDRLSRYYTLRRKMAKSFDNLRLETALKVIKSGSVGFLPYRDRDGKGIYTTRGYNWYPEVCEFEEWVLTAVIIGLQFLFIPANAVNGITYLIDMQARDYAQVYLYFKHIKNNTTLAHSLPARLCIECLHENYICHCLYTFLKPHLPKKIVKRLQLHGYDYSSLHESFDPCILPEEYGGTLGPLNYDFLLDKFESFFIKFKEDNRLFLKK